MAVKVLETLSNSSNSLEFEKSFLNEPPGSAQPNMPKIASQKSSEKSNIEFNDEQKKHRASFNKYWNYRKSIRLAAKAYTVARQEIAILNSLKHENVVSMLGLSIQPLAIILELAPLGNLKDILTDYKAHMCKLTPGVIQRVCTQISSALVYLHSNRIIYRDLKADNVLVWKFPRPNQLNIQNSIENNVNLTTNTVHLKLADYSISRCVLPTGTKGFAGTPGYSIFFSFFLFQSFPLLEIQQVFIFIDAKYLCPTVLLIFINKVLSHNSTGDIFFHLSKNFRTDFFRKKWSKPWFLKVFEKKNLENSFACQKSPVGLWD